MRIISLTAENVKRLRAVEITPDGDVVIVAGRNAQGKTSVLDAIWFALGGGPAQRDTVRPIRDGETDAFAEVDLGDLVVTRTWSGDKTTLAVRSGDGARYSSPQKMLDELVGRLSFDPLGFAQLDARKQLAAMLEVVDLPFDPTQLAATRLGKFEDRTEVNREIKQLDARLEAMPPINDAIPKEEQSASDVVEQLTKAQAWEQDCRAAERRDEEQERRLVAAQQELAAAQSDRQRAFAEMHAAWAVGQSQPGIVSPEYDVAALTARLTGIEELNGAIRLNREADALARRRAELSSAAHGLGKEIEGIDEYKRVSLEQADMPVPGLGFDDDGVTYQGVPFKQCSSAEQLRVSVAVAMALNPKVRVIRISDGSLLDSDSMRLIAGMAADRDFQVWVERVDESGEVGVVIEDGMVRS